MIQTQVQNKSIYRVFGSGPDSDHSGGSDHSGQRSYYGKDGSGQHLSHRVTDAGVQRVSQSIESLPKSKSQDFELGEYLFKVLVHRPCRVGSVGSVSPSRTVGREFASRPGHTKDHHKNVTNCLPA